ncbi:hypothetical protein AOQ71_26075 [Bradyrhizobium manausense]|uniref:Uncharacterized protein n=2 Tax=Bradyrhizobium manausense TaxID=989370 RepID=A0A0R3D9V1_9BRAD|nr:hypothetical protein AOQ71_26075 [Bradyrhizobium manausense]
MHQIWLRGLFAEHFFQMEHRIDGSQFNPSYLNPSASEIAQQNADIGERQQASDASLQASFEEHVSELRAGSGPGRRARRNHDQAFGEDVALISEAKRTARGRGVPDRSVANAGTDIQNLSIWLRENSKAPLAARGDDESLQADVRDYINGGGSRSVVSSVNKLLPGTLPSLDEVLGRPPRAIRTYPEDARLINEAVQHAAREHGASTGEQRRSIHMRATRLRYLSEWLLNGHRGSIAGRFNGDQQQQDAFQADVAAYREVISTRRDRTLTDADLALLQNRLHIVGTGQAPRLRDPAQPGLPVMESDREVVRRQEFSAITIAGASAPALDIAGPSSSVRPPSDIYGGLESFIDLNAPTPYDLRDDAHSAPALDVAGPSSPVRPPSDIYGGLESFIDLNAPTPYELRDDAHSVPAQDVAGPSSSIRPPSDIYGGLESFIDLNAPAPHELRDNADSAPRRTSPDGL